MTLNLEMNAQTQIRENEREREALSYKKPNVRSDFADALSDNGDVSVEDVGAFCVGMVAKHKKYNYHCVIFGWDPICKASKVSVRRQEFSFLPS
jgi:hypothetical protein